MGKNRWMAVLGGAFLLVPVLSGCAPPAFVVRAAPAQAGLRESAVPGVGDRGVLLFDKIAVVDVDGLMVNQQRQGLFSRGENPVSLFVEKLQAARRDRFVRAVVLRLNSPGGTVAASDTMYHALEEFRRVSGKPVVACMLDVAASGAYYLACGCDGIVAQPTTVTGSIGTILQTVSFAGTMQKLGITAEAIKSGDLKDLGSPLHELRPEERVVLRGIILRFYERFLEVVLAGRPTLTRDKLLPLADGRVFTAQAALQEGLIDRIGYPADAIAWAKQLAGVERAKVVMYHRPLGAAPTVYASTAAGNVESLVNIDLPEWLKADGPQFLYLWRVGP